MSPWCWYCRCTSQEEKYLYKYLYETTYALETQNQLKRKHNKTNWTKIKVGTENSKNKREGVLSFSLGERFSLGRSGARASTISEVT